MWTCDIKGCDRVAVRTRGEYVICGRHLCANHIARDFHTCPVWQDGEQYNVAARIAENEEITKLLASINVSALLSRASDLRNGIPCSLSETLQYDRSTRRTVMGGMNYHIGIRFEDGVVWLARIRRSNATSPPPDLRDYIIRSEVATLQFLGKTKVPVPKVFDYNVDPGNPVGLGYILMERVAGRSLEWALASTEARKKIMDQLADIYAELASFPFDTMGSLDQPGTDHIGPLARESLTDYADNRMLLLGPMRDSAEYLSAKVEFNIDMLMRGEVYAGREIDAFLVHKFLLDSIPALMLSHRHDDGKFYLRHADDNGDHILVDGEHNITGIIDWEWAYTESKSAAFRTPIMLLPVGEFYDGSNHTGEDELTFAAILEGKGHPELAAIVRNGRIFHFFEFCCGYDFADWEGFLGLFKGLREALGTDMGLDWEAWRQMALERYANDERLKRLLLR
ncbi:hypothetical protein BDV25DRAFT_149605 [Aspergillus avenaceus]|uniref:Aminoglycoside phosphotransferase domain-containing protein n=1 Tax=Aspergillus avenaceus TaxID=36643 RepID=A0A5N6U4L0_ASPAV|nr:hypothetical protein BDV25DRAFT_149605 [Aspergillus avenaceus]